MSTLLKKVVFSVLSGLVLLLSFAPLLTVNAQAPAENTTTWYNQDFKSWYGKVYDPDTASEIFGERYTAAQVQWVIYGFFGFLINTTTGPENSEVVKCFLDNAVDINTCTAALSKLADKTNSNSPVADNPPQNQNLWSLVFADRPLSGVSYVKEKFGKLKLVPEVHAQAVGFGFDALRPIQGMWKAFRDIAFGLFVIVAVVFAFMIMFRVKLSPQTVISVQSALPKIVTALILVTFSYAIAGFLVDLMYVVIGIVSLAADRIFSISLNGIGLNASAYFNFLTLGQPFSGFGNVGAGLGIILLIGIFFLMIFTPILILLLIIIGLLTASGVGAPVAAILFWFFAILLVLAILIALWMGVKILWSLLKAFTNILLLTIFAPIHIALGTIIPNLGFGQWIKSFVSNLAVFVVTGVLMLFSFLFIILGIIDGIKNIPNIAIDTAKSIIGYLLGPLLGTAISTAINNGLDLNKYASWPPLLGGGTGPMVGLLFLGVAFVLFTLIPKANEIIQGLLSGKPFAYGTAIGEAFGPISGAAGGMAGGIGKSAQEYGSTYALKRLAAEMERRQWNQRGIGKELYGALPHAAEGQGGRPARGSTVSPEEVRS